MITEIAMIYLLIKYVIHNTTTMKAKKNEHIIIIDIDKKAHLEVVAPILKGNASWEFEYKSGVFSKRILVKIEDEEFLKSHRERKRNLLPGDIILGTLKKVEQVQTKDNEEEVIKETYHLLKYHETIPPSQE